jgi:hypothetical protein
VTYRRLALSSFAIPLTLSALLLAACNKPKDVVNPVAPAATAVAPQFSYAQANDVRVAPQFTKGWYGVEDGAWRWMAKESETTLKNPGVFPAQFEVRLTIPKPIMDAVGAPVTFTVLLDGKPLGDAVYKQDGAYIFEKTVPPGMAPPGPITVTMRVDKAKPPVNGGDARELGAIIEGLGFK